MNKCKNCMGVIFLNLVSCISTFNSFMITMFEYKGKGSGLSDIVSLDAVLVIKFFIVISFISSSIAFVIKRKNKLQICIYTILLILNSYRFLQVIKIIGHVKNGELPSL